MQPHRKGLPVRLFGNKRVLYTIRDGQVYKGTSNYRSDIIATNRYGKVYRGTSNYSSDILFNIDGVLTIEEFVAVRHAVNYVY